MTAREVLRLAWLRLVCIARGHRWTVWHEVKRTTRLCRRCCKAGRA